MITGQNPWPEGSDEHFMYRALQLAQRGLGWTSPNPLVGCVIVRDGKLISEGWHARYGETHAEVAAIRAAGDCRGATAYVSLEPCSHKGRQAMSCSNTLIAAGLSRVVYCLEDPDPRSHGRAAGLLAEAGILAQCGLLAAEGAMQLDSFRHNQVRGACFICLKLAMSLDGRIACANGSSQWLSGPVSHGYAHFLRQKYDAILVGSGTVRADNPKLTTRAGVLQAFHHESGQLRLRNICRVVLDPRFELLPELGSYAVSDLSGEFRDDLPRLLLAGREDSIPGQAVPDGVELLGLPVHGGRLDFRELGSALWQRGIRSLLVEGGATLAASLLEQDSADQLCLVYTPLLIGNEGLSFSPSLGLEKLADAPGFKLLDSVQLEQDVLLVLSRAG